MEKQRKRIVNILIALGVVSVPALLVVFGHMVDLTAEELLEEEDVVQFSADSTPVDVSKYLELATELASKKDYQTALLVAELVPEKHMTNDLKYAKNIWAEKAALSTRVN